ncbi:unnamed protein product [Peronospora effusa]|nr:unnamed protein product [Peronospora effusa]
MNWVVSKTKTKVVAAMHAYLSDENHTIELLAVKQTQVSTRMTPAAQSKSIGTSTPSSRQSIAWASTESIPAMREILDRYSAADNVQYTLTTDSNLFL